MRTWTQSRYGGPEVLTLREIPDIDTSAVTAGKVLVRVTAVPVEAASLHLMTGQPWVARVVTGVREPSRRPVPGVAAAGVVHAVGPGVDGFAPGDRVVGVVAGSLAEQVVVSARALARIPDGVSDAAAAVLPVSGGTALQAVDAALIADDVRGTEVPDRRRVLVIGAGGSVGSIATQLAVRAGADVTAVASAAKADFVASCGAHRHIDYRRTPDPRDWGLHDAVIETADGRALSVLRQALTPRGTLVVVGADHGGGALLGPASRQLHALLQNPFTRQRLVPLAQRERVSDTERLLGMIADGHLTIPLVAEYGFDRAPEAYKAFGSSRPAGTLIIRVAADRA